MAALTACKIANGVFQLPILNEVEVDAEADVEALVDLTAEILGHTFNKHLLAKASNVQLHVIASGKSGSPDFTLDTLKARYKGTSDEVLAYLGITIDDDAVHDVVRLPDGLGPALALRFGATVATLDGSNKITMTAFLTFNAF